MKAQNVLIVGLGRVGASVGLALKKAGTNLNISGYDHDDATMKAARDMDAVDSTHWKLGGQAANADIVVITVPVTELKKTFQGIGIYLKDHTLVLDMSAAKQKGQEWAAQYLEKGHYVGVRPILTAEAMQNGRTDLQGADADLFRNSVYCLMPSPTADPKAVETAVNMGLLLGAKPFFLDAAEFDSLAQGVQTLPGLSGAVMFRAMTTAPGWRDMLRFAETSFAQATMPLAEHGNVAFQAIENQEATLRWLDAYLAELKRIRDWIYAGEDARLEALLDQLNTEREKWLQERLQNEWQEEHPMMKDYEPPSFMQSMFGRLAGRRDKKDE